VIEIDISRSSLDRFPIFASIGVPEVWRYDGMRVVIFTLAGGAYQAQETSAAFPGVTSQSITRFMEESKTLKRTVWLHRVRAWARQQGDA
jgi:hypothetical protein